MHMWAAMAVLCGVCAFRCPLRVLKACRHPAMGSMQCSTYSGPTCNIQVVRVGAILVISDVQSELGRGAVGLGEPHHRLGGVEGEHRGAKDVGESTTKAVVLCYVMILILNFFLTLSLNVMRNEIIRWFS